MSSSAPETIEAWPALPGYRTDEVDKAVEGGHWDASLVLASATLERLTAHRVGITPVVVRPCSPRASQRAPREVFPFAGSAIAPVNWGGRFYNVCEHQGACSCSSRCEVALPPPVGRIDLVRANGVVVSPDDYVVQNGHIIVWRGSGPCPFVLDQDLSKPLTEPGTFGVTYLNAYPVDESGQLAVTALALEFAKALGDPKKCRLPSNVTNVTRAGVTVSLVAKSFATATNIPEVDAWIALYNPKGLHRASSVWSPDLPQYRYERS